MPLARTMIALLIVGFGFGVGCTMHARQFLPSTGRYILSGEDQLDGGWQWDVFIVTDDRGPVSASVRVWSVDAGVTPSILAPDSVADEWMQNRTLRASVMLVNPENGSLETAQGSLLIPEPIALGARWRVRAARDDSCFLEEEIVAVSGRTLQIAHRFGCGTEQPALFMKSVWQVGAGETEFMDIDGGAVVRLRRAP